MGKVRLKANQDLREVADWLVINVGPEACNRNLPVGHRRGNGWHLHVNYVGTSEWYTADVELEDNEKMLLFLLTFPTL